MRLRSLLIFVLALFALGGDSVRIGDVARPKFAGIRETGRGAFSKIKGVLRGAKKRIARHVSSLRRSPTSRSVEEQETELARHGEETKEEGQEETKEEGQEETVPSSLPPPLSIEQAELVEDLACYELAFLSSEDGCEPDILKAIDETNRALGAPSEQVSILANLVLEGTTTPESVLAAAKSQGLDENLPWLNIEASENCKEAITALGVFAAEVPRAALDFLSIDPDPIDQVCSTTEVPLATQKMLGDFRLSAIALRDKRASSVPK